MNALPGGLPGRALRSRVAALVMGLALAAAGAVVATRLEVSTGLADWLASSGDRRLARLSRELAASELTRTLVLTVGVPSDAGPADLDAAVAVAADLAARLARDEQVAWVRRGSDEALERAIHDLVFPARLGLLSTRPEVELPALLTDEGLRARAREVKRELTQPSAPLVKRLVPDDPLLAFLGHLRRLEASRAGELDLRDGQLVTPDGRFAVLFLGTKGSPFDAGAMGPLLARLDASFREAARAHRAPLALDRGGVHPFAVASESSIRGDVSRVSTVSTVAVALLFLLAFRSLRAVVLSALPLGAALLAGTALVLLAHGRVHGLTLAFGATLIGVCVDYPIHLMTHHALAPGRDCDATLRRIGAGLLLGAGTTVVGMGLLGLASFPGLREVALFTVTGVAAALATTAALLPPALPGIWPAPPSLRAASDRAAGLLARLQARPRLAAAPALLALLVALGGLPRVRWEDDVAALDRRDPGLVAEEQRVRERVARVDPGRLVVSRGADAEAALRGAEAAAFALEPLAASGAVGEVRAPTPLLPSRDLQRRNRAALVASPDLPARLLRAFEAEGFRAAGLAAGAAAIGSATEAPLLEPEAVLASPLADLARPFLSCIPGEEGEADEVAAFVFLRDVRDPAAVERALAHLPGVDLFDQRAWLGAAYGSHRRGTLLLAAAGLGLVLLLVLARHRRLEPTLAAVVPAALSAATTLGALALLGEGITLLHVMSLLLVVSVGVDHGVYLVEDHVDARETGATLLAIAISCATTVLSFGLLAASSAPPLRAIGLTVGIGVALSLVLAPVPLAFVRLSPRAPSPGASPAGVEPEVAAGHPAT